MTTRNLTALVSTIGFCMGAIACGSSSEDAPAAGGTTGNSGGSAGATGGSTNGGSSAGGSANGGGGSSAGGAANGGGGSSAGGATGGDCTPLSPTGTPPDLIMSEIVPGMGIEVFNPGATAVPVTNNIWFCSQFDYQQATSPGGKTEVPPGGYVVLAWPDTASYELATAAGGEILMYLGTDFAPTETTQQDYVCWGNHTGGRKDEPIGGGTLFPGPCAPAMTAGAIARKPATPGGDAASFDSAAAPSLADCPM